MSKRTVWRHLLGERIFCVPALEYFAQLLNYAPLNEQPQLALALIFCVGSPRKRWIMN